MSRNQKIYLIVALAILVVSGFTIGSMVATRVSASTNSTTSDLSLMTGTYLPEQQAWASQPATVVNSTASDPSHMTGTYLPAMQGQPASQLAAVPDSTMSNYSLMTGTYLPAMQGQ